MVKVPRRPLRPRSNLGGGVNYILFLISMEPNSKSEIGIGTYGCYSSFKFKGGGGKLF